MTAKYEYRNAWGPTDRDELASQGFRVHTVIPPYYSPDGRFHQAAYLMDREVPNESDHIQVQAG